MWLLYLLLLWELRPLRCHHGRRANLDTLGVSASKGSRGNNFLMKMQGRIVERQLRLARRWRCGGRGRRSDLAIRWQPDCAACRMHFEGAVADVEAVAKAAQTKPPRSRTKTRHQWTTSRHAQLAGAHLPQTSMSSVTGAQMQQQTLHRNGHWILQQLRRHKVQADHRWPGDSLMTWLKPAATMNQMTTTTQTTRVTLKASLQTVTKNAT